MNPIQKIFLIPGWKLKKSVMVLAKKLEVSQLESQREALADLLPEFDRERKLSDIGKPSSSPFNDELLKQYKRNCVRQFKSVDREYENAKVELKRINSIKIHWNMNQF